MQSFIKPEYLKRASQRGIKPGLSRMKALLCQLSDPQDSLSFVHVAGTNGKGSVTAYTASILKTAGYKTGEYYSPAVDGILGQYRINGKNIGEEEFLLLLGRIEEAEGRLEERGEELPTSFEIETALAFLYFKENRCDIVILEAGMGGLSDATNVIENTFVAILTSISEDHIGILGDNVEEIAMNKAGIIKRGCGGAVCVGDDRDVLKVAEKVCRDRKVPLNIVMSGDIKDPERKLYEQSFSYAGMRIKLSQGGYYQCLDAAEAVSACILLRERGFLISDAAIRKGLYDTFIPYRFERICMEPEIVLDGAHNPGAAEALVKTLTSDTLKRSRILVLGMFKDKDYKKVCRILYESFDLAVVLAAWDNPRALGGALLKKELEGLGLKTVEAENVKEAFSFSFERAKRAGEKGEKPLIVVCGSFSYLYEFRNEVLIHQGLSIS